MQCVSHVKWPQHVPWANSSWNNQQIVEESTQAAREVIEALGGGTPENMVHALGQWIIDHVKARRHAGARNQWCWPMTFTCCIISIALRHAETGSEHDCRTLLDRFGVTVGGARQNPFQRWCNLDDTRNANFEPGTLPPGAQSQGRRGSLVSRVRINLSDATVGRLGNVIRMIGETADGCSGGTRRPTEVNQFSAKGATLT